jgi:hypothetical protein
MPVARREQREVAITSRTSKTRYSSQGPGPSLYKTEGHEPTKKFQMVNLSLEENRDSDQVNILTQ